MERKRKKIMRNMKKLFAVLIAAVMVMAMGICAMAAGEGSIKITNAAATRTYTAYKVFDATASGKNVAYTTGETGKSVIEADTDAPFTVTQTAVAGVYNVQQKEGTSDEDVTGWLDDNHQSFGSTGVTGTYDSQSGTYTISNLDLGYYYVSTGTGSAVSIDTVTGTDKEIKDKNTQGPGSPDKKITAKNGTNLAASTESNDAQIGSTETFEVTYNATNWVTSGSGTNVTTTKVKNFYIKDTPTGLSIDESTVKVTVNGTEITKTTDYTVAVSSTNGELTITIPWVDDSENFKYQPVDGATSENIQVKVTYDAAITAVAATKAATNEVHIYYNHDSSSTTDGTEVTTPENPPKTTTDTYKFELNKTDGTNALAGAQFELYDGTSKVELVANGATYRVAAAGESGSTTTIDMTKNTTVEIQGLDNKDYTLKEITAPDGYTLAADTTIGSTDNTSATNKLIKESGTYSDSATGKVTVVNKAGTVLPSTGGIGTTVFYVLGAILAIGAGILLITRRRMSARS